MYSILDLANSDFQFALSYTCPIPTVAFQFLRNLLITDLEVEDVILSLKYAAHTLRLVLTLKSYICTAKERNLLEIGWKKIQSLAFTDNLEKRKVQTYG